MLDIGIKFPKDIQKIYPLYDPSIPEYNTYAQYLKKKGVEKPSKELYDQMRLRIFIIYHELLDRNTRYKTELNASPLWKGVKDSYLLERFSRGKTIMRQCGVDLVPPLTEEAIKKDLRIGEPPGPDLPDKRKSIVDIVKNMKRLNRTRSMDKYKPEKPKKPKKPPVPPAPMPEGVSDMDVVPDVIDLTIPLPVCGPPIMIDLTLDEKKVPESTVEYAMRRFLNLVAPWREKGYKRLVSVEKLHNGDGILKVNLRHKDGPGKSIYGYIRNPTTNKKIILYGPGLKKYDDNDKQVLKNYLSVAFRLDKVDSVTADWRNSSFVNKHLTALGNTSLKVGLVFEKERAQGVIRGAKNNFGISILTYNEVNRLLENGMPQFGQSALKTRGIKHQKVKQTRNQLNFDFSNNNWLQEGEFISWMVALKQVKDEIENNSVGLNPPYIVDSAYIPPQNYQYLGRDVDTRMPPEVQQALTEKNIPSLSIGPLRYRGNKAFLWKWKFNRESIPESFIMLAFKIMNKYLGVDRYFTTAINYGQQDPDYTKLNTDNDGDKAFEQFWLDDDAVVANAGWCTQKLKQDCHERIFFKDREKKILYVIDPHMKCKDTGKFARQNWVLERIKIKFKKLGLGIENVLCVKKEEEQGNEGSCVAISALRAIALGMVDHYWKDKDTSNISTVLDPKENNFEDIKCKLDSLKFNLKPWIPMMIARIVSMQDKGVAFRQNMCKEEGICFTRYNGERV